MSTTNAGLNAYTFTKHERVFLRDISKDERWLQDRILENPSILGLGDVVVHSKEKMQRLGGRLDFLLLDTETEPETMYEVEVMCGATDESHIIRTIEYWDVESRRFRDREYRAVIVAEEITNRFFNVIWLLSRSLPIIALQLNALTVDGKLLLHFTKVLDLFERPDSDDEEQSAHVDRAWWEKQSPEGMKLFESLLAILEREGLHSSPNYRSDWIGLDGRTCRNIIALKPGKKEVCRLSFGKLRAISESENNAARLAWETAGADLNDKANDKFSIKLTRQFVEQNAKFIADQIKHVFELCDHE